MAKFLKRLNKENHKYTFEFKLLSFAINLSSKTLCRIKIIIEKSDKSVETGTDPLLENKIAIFDETLKLDLTLYFDKKRQKYLEKVLQINVILILEEEEKLAGSIDFDVAHLLNTFVDLPIIKSLDNCPDPKSQLKFEVTYKKLDQKSKSENINRSSYHEKQSPSIKSIRSPSFGSSNFVTPKKNEENIKENSNNQINLTVKSIDLTGNLQQDSVEKDDLELRESFGKKEIRVSFGGEIAKKDVYADKYMESQLNLQKNMEKYEEVINLNLELKKEKDEEGSVLRKVIDEKNKALMELANMLEGTDSHVQAQLHISQDKIKILEQQIKETIDEHESKEIQLKAIIESQNNEISSLKGKLNNHTNKIRLFLLKESNKFNMKPLPKPSDLNEILPSSFQTIDMQGLMQGIYRKTEDIFKQLNEKLVQSNETIVKLKEFIMKHSQIIENLQSKIGLLEQENASLKAFTDINPKDSEETKELNLEIHRLKEIISEKDEKIEVLERNLNENQTILNEIKEHSDRLEREILDNKRKISEAMNMAFETGGSELVEFLEKSILSMGNG